MQVTILGLPCKPGGPQVIDYPIVLHKFETPSCSTAVEYLKSWLADPINASYLQNHMFSLAGPLGYLIDQLNPNETQLWINRANYFAH